jgi:hypothetical protein
VAVIACNLVPPVVYPAVQSLRMVAPFPPGVTSGNLGVPTSENRW